MGGFSSYSFGLTVRPKQPLLVPGELDRLQAALLRGAPGWSSRVHIASLGVWPVRTAVEMNVPGSLAATIWSHLPGGTRARAGVGTDLTSEHEAEARIGGADRGGYLTLRFGESLQPKRPTNWRGEMVMIETTKPEITGIPVAAWIEELFRAICEEMAPRWARASSHGERGARLRRYGADAFGRHLDWLTYFGPSDSAGLDLAAAANLPGIECSNVAGGHLLRLGAAPSARNYGRYLRLLETTEAALGKDRVAELSDLDRRTRAEYPPAVAALPEPESIPKPSVSKDRWGREVVQGGRYQRTRFTGIGYSTPGGVLDGFDVEKCEFDNVSIGVNVVEPGMAARMRRLNPSFVSHEYDLQPVVVRNCTLTRCRVWAAYLRYVLIEDSILDGLSGSLPMTSEVLLKHVVVRGPIDSIDIRHPGQVMGPEPLIALHDAHYATVDWALDISEARFARCDIGGVPGRLVRRDPKTQVLVTRGRVLAAPWQDVAEGEWKVGIERLLMTEAESKVFVACPRGDRFQETLAVFQQLREAGIAEPD